MVDAESICIIQTIEHIVELGKCFKMSTNKCKSKKEIAIFASNYQNFFVSLTYPKSFTFMTILW